MLAVDFVLGNFNGDDAITMDRTLDRAVAAVSVFLTEGIEAAMNQFNSVNELKLSAKEPKVDKPGDSGR